MAVCRWRRWGSGTAPAATGTGVIEALVVPSRIGCCCGVATHIAIAVEPLVRAIRTGELPGCWIVVPRVVVVEPRGAIRPLPGVAQRRRRTATIIAGDAMRREEQRADDIPTRIQRFGDTDALNASPDK